jgi:hypothetical protein
MSGVFPNLSGMDAIVAPGAMQVVDWLPISRPVS